MATPLEMHGGILVKRDDLFTVAGVNGGKARTCDYLVRRAKLRGIEGVVTAGARTSPQANIVAAIAKSYGLHCRIHMPSGELGLQAVLAQNNGAEIIQHKPGYNSVIIKRARDDARMLGWAEIPFGMECTAAIEQTKQEFYETYPAIMQLAALRKYVVNRIIMVIGSGMSFCGVLTALDEQKLDATTFNSSAREYVYPHPIIGIYVGADPMQRLMEYGPFGWQQYATLRKSPLPYQRSYPNPQLGDLELDPYYEAKCLPFIEEGDLFWVVGKRETA